MYNASFMTEFGSFLNLVSLLDKQMTLCHKALTEATLFTGHL